MMKRKRRILKELIAVLIEGPISREDFKDIIIANNDRLTPEALRKQESRYLQELKELGLVKLVDELISWYKYDNNFETLEDYHLRLKHSEELIPGFLAILAQINRPDYRIGPEELDDNYEINSLNMTEKIARECAIEHLKDENNKKISAAYKKLRALSNQGKSSRTHLLRQLSARTIAQFGGLDENKENENSIILDNFPLVMYNKLIEGSLGISTELEERDGFITIHQGSIRVASEPSVIDQLTVFISNELVAQENVQLAEEVNKNRQHIEEIKQGLERSLTELVMAIKSGQTLFGSCSLCPRIKIRKKIDPIES
jgi:hypothetical protein